MRGDHMLYSVLRNVMLGTSPHARGPLHVVPRRPARPGNIPACAGTTAARMREKYASREHPRMRGDHRFWHRRNSKARGTSPHARGPPDLDLRIEVRPGNIPACAGTTLVGSGIRRRRGEHPRMRGDHSKFALPPDYVTGTSPHARGPRIRCLNRLFVCGNIPACAGTTSPSARSRTQSWEHPRMRGDHFHCTTASTSKSGTSPHARGPLAIPKRYGLFPGNIPACAGTTPGLALKRDTPREHPRMRGDHRCWTATVIYATGTSPHARGPRSRRSS